MMIKVLVSVPKSLKAKLDAERRRGTTTSGLVRHLLEQHFNGQRAAPSQAARRGFDEH